MFLLILNQGGVLKLNLCCAYVASFLGGETRKQPDWKLDLPPYAANVVPVPLGFPLCMGWWKSVQTGNKGKRGWQWWCRSSPPVSVCCARRCVLPNGSHATSGDVRSQSSWSADFGASALSSALSSWVGLLISSCLLCKVVQKGARHDLTFLSMRESLLFLSPSSFLQPACKRFLLPNIMSKTGVRLCDCGNNDRFRKRPVCTSSSEAHVHAPTSTREHPHADDPVKLIFSVFPLCSCLAHTPYPLNWILAHFQVQCLRVPYLK